MLTSIAVILLSGLFTGWIFSKLRLPSLLGMIIVGIVLSPHALNLIDESLLMISADLRQIALVIILTRAGLSLNISDLKRVGRPAVLMCFVPACTEIAGTVLLAPVLLNVSILDAAIIGSVIAAVSPAVIVPRMIRLIEEGYGKANSIPQLVLAGASVDDVFVIVIFTAFTALAATGEMSAAGLIQIPISIVSGILLGCCVGSLLVLFFKKKHMRSAVLLIIGALLFRMMGVALSLLKTNLSKKERLFCMLAYTPKATVQAAIGSIPLAMELECGNIVLTVAVLSILITAPFGAVCVDNLYKRLLE